MSRFIKVEFSSTLYEQMRESIELDAVIRKNLEVLGYGVRGKKEIFNSFVYYTIREKVSNLQRGNDGSIFNTIIRETFKTIKIASGKPNLSEKLENRIKLSFNRILANRFSSKTFSNLRDTLLPKLLSGEIRIPDAEKLVEDLE